MKGELVAGGRFRVIKASLRTREEMVGYCEETQRENRECSEESIPCDIQETS